MEHTYERIEYCISKTLGMTSQFLEIDAFEERQLRVELTDTFETLQKRLTSLVFNEADPRRIEICIQHIQRQLVYLAEKLEEAVHSISLANAIHFQHKNLLEFASQKIERALSVLEQSFGRYMDMQEKVSPGYRIKFQQELQVVLQELQPTLQGLHLKKSYVQMICTAASIVSIENIGQHLTYHAAGYLRRMYKQLLILVKGLSPREAVVSINEFLVGINFNAPFFINILTGSVHENVIKAISDEEKSAILNSWQKTVSQYFQTTSTPFIPTMPGARDSLLNWVQVELNCLGKCSHEKPSISMHQPGADTNTNITLGSNLTVPQLAALCRILFDRGIIQHKNKQEMFQALSRLFKTQDTTVISPVSFGNKFYSVSANTARSIKSLMLDMSNDARELMQ